jgi:hypothetical protein
MRTVYFYLTALVLIGFSCAEEKEMTPISESSGKPGTVDVLGFDTLPGGVLINYRIPPVNDILEIKAVYTLTNGQKRESSASYYTSFMTLEGYNDTEEHEAQIYTINRAREMSEPVTVRFRPGESSLSKTIRSMQIGSDFGGVNFNWRNPDQAMLIFEFYTEDEQGEMATMDIMSSKTDSTDIAFRGFDTTPRKFAVNIRDNFGNSSGMIYPDNGYVIPLYEEMLDKKIQRAMTVGDDPNWDNWEGRLVQLIDDDPLSVAHTGYNARANASITLDIGKTAKLSRIRVHQRIGSSDYWYLYRRANFQIFEVYTSDEPGDEPSGDWSQWTLRATCTITKPSGASLGTTTDEDMEQAINGHDFKLPLDMPPVRYIRLKLVKSWETVDTFTYLGELTVFGVYEEGSRSVKTPLPPYPPPANQAGRDEKRRTGVFRNSFGNKQ